MLFRVWKPNANCYDTDTDSFRIDNKLNLWWTDPCISDWRYADPKRFVVEFNTGIALADGTETFFSDIVKITDVNWGYGGKYDKTHDGYKYIVITKDSLSDMISYLLCDGNVWHDDVKLVGNIHETELTDAMKVWIKN